ncbi:TetR/AcrR family transcriptional regulator [Paenibacillus terrae]
MSGIHGDKYEAILDAAYTVFGTRGFYESKISEIAGQAGVAKGTVYLYFKSKEQLFTAVTRRDCEQYLAEMQGALANRPLEGVQQPELHAQAFIGMMERLKMDILLDKDFREYDVDQTAEFAANLFMHGCKAGSGIRRL